MGDIEIRGGANAKRIAAKFEKEAVKGLRRELRQGLNRATKPMIRAAREAALEDLPHRGGLNRIVAKSRMATRTRADGIRIVATGIDQLDLIDKSGVVVHPTYGHRPRVIQSIPPAQGWFTDTMEDQAEEPRKELVRVVLALARRLEGA
jgi:hypothetical protein